MAATWRPHGGHMAATLGGNYRQWRKHWDMIRSESYGMRTTKFESPTIPLAGVHLLNDGKSVFLECAMPATDLYQLTLAYTKADGSKARILMHGSAFNLRPAVPPAANAAPKYRGGAEKGGP